METAETGESETTGSEIGNAQVDETPTESATASAQGDESSKPDKEVEKPEETQAPEGEEAPIAAYTPNTKLKIQDNDYEIPKEFQSLMKDEKSEKMVREIFEKAYGLEYAKPRHEKTKLELAQTKTDLGGIQEQIQDLRTGYHAAVKSKNWLKLEDTFRKLEIPDEVILQYAAARVNLEDMPPEQRQVLEGRLQAERQAESLSREKMSGDQRLTQMSQELKRLALDSGLARPEVKTIADAYDAREGTPGAFAQEVIREGQLEWFSSKGKVDLTPEQAIQRVIERRRLNAVASEAPAGASVAPPAKGQPTTRQIPNVSGRSASPLKSKPKSIDDLKKLYQQKVDEETV